MSQPAQAQKQQPPPSEKRNPYGLKPVRVRFVQPFAVLGARMPSVLTLDQPSATNGTAMQAQAMELHPAGVLASVEGKQVLVPWTAIANCEVE